MKPHVVFKPQQKGQKFFKSKQIFHLFINGYTSFLIYTHKRKLAKGQPTLFRLFKDSIQTPHRHQNNPYFLYCHISGFPSVTELDSRWGFYNNGFTVGIELPLPIFTDSSADYTSVRFVITLVFAGVYKWHFGVIFYKIYKKSKKAVNWYNFLISTTHHHPKNPDSRHVQIYFLIGKIIDFWLL